MAPLDAVDALARNARQRPEGRAIESADASYTHAQLLAEVERTAERLREANVQVLALAADNSPDWIVCDLAAHLAAAAVVPLPPFFSTQQIAHAIADSCADAIVFDGFGASVLGRECVADCEQLSERLFISRVREPARRYSRYGSAKISYTSGTTGSPRGVALSWAAQNQVANSLVAVTGGLDLIRHTCILPLGVLLENIAGVYAPLIAGATVVCPSLREIGLAMSGAVDGSRLLDLLCETRASSVIVLPQILSALVDATEAQKPPKDLQFVAVGGASTAQSLLQRAREHGLPVYEGYGLTECSSVVSINVPGADRVGSVGRPLPHARVRVADDGEIVVSGAVLDGYTRGEAHAESEFSTGDVGFVDADGFVYISGRKKNAFVSSFGRNVSPEWIESALNGFAAIEQAVVFGENRPWVVAVVTAAQGATAQQVDDAIRRANETLPDYARIGQWISSIESFCVDNEMLTPNGRYRRAEIFCRHESRIEACYEANGQLQWNASNQVRCNSAGTTAHQTGAWND